MAKVFQWTISEEQLAELQKEHLRQKVYRAMRGYLMRKHLRKRTLGGAHVSDFRMNRKDRKAFLNWVQDKFQPTESIVGSRVNSLEGLASFVVKHRP